MTTQPTPTTRNDKNEKENETVQYEAVSRPVYDYNLENNIQHSHEQFTNVMSLLVNIYQLPRDVSIISLQFNKERNRSVFAGERYRAE